MRNLFLLACCLAAAPVPVAAKLQLAGSPVTVGVDELRFSILDTDGKSVKFRFAGGSIDPGGTPTMDLPGNFIMLKGITWTTPARVEFTIHSYWYVSGRASNRLSLHFETLDEEPASTVAGQVYYKSFRDSFVGIGGVVNSYSQEPVLSPGALVSILDDSASFPPQTAILDIVARYPKTLYNRNVAINGIEAPIRSVSGNRIDIIVPYEIAGQTTAQVVLRQQNGSGPISAPVTLPVREAAPAIRVVAADGKGQADAGQVFDQKRSMNSLDNPAPAGAAIELFCTGAGSWQMVPDTDIVFGRLDPMQLYGVLPFTVRPVSVTIGGMPAQVLYAGTSVGQPWGVLQVNVVVPFGVAAGPQPVVLRIGDFDNRQQGVTITVKE